MFSDDYCLTQAVLDGTKTMTRRLLKEGTPLGNWEGTQKKLPYKVGEVVAIAQSYYTIGKTQYDKFGNGVPGNHNKMFTRAELMPHHIKITDVKVERLQSISDADILKEGVWQRFKTSLFYVSKNVGYAPYVAFPTAREAFWFLIDKVSGKGTWESNPWVVAYSFELVD
nr:MAG TPA: ASCH domain protein [Caudoviricetes sp.]